MSSPARECVLYKSSVEINFVTSCAKKKSRTPRINKLLLGRCALNVCHPFNVVTNDVSLFICYLSFSLSLCSHSCKRPVTSAHGVCQYCIKMHCANSIYRMKRCKAIKRAKIAREQNNCKKSRCSRCNVSNF